MADRGQIGQIAELIDMLVAKGVKGIRISGFGDFAELDLELYQKRREATELPNLSVAPSNLEDEDLQYAASGMIPVKLSEIKKE